MSDENTLPSNEVVNQDLQEQQAQPVDNLPVQKSQGPTGKGLKITKQTSNRLLEKLFDRAGIVPDEPKYSQNWEQLEGLYQVLAESIVTSANQINNCRQELMALGMVNDAEAAVTIRGAARDLEQFTTELVAIHEGHAGKKGRVKDGGELSDVIAIFNDYTTLQDRFRALFFPCMVTLTEAIMRAKAARTAANNEQTQAPASPAEESSSQ